MKKQLLSLAMALALAPAFNANAQASITEVWRYMTTDYNDGWDSGAPDWTSEDAIKQKSCVRMGTGKDGKIYTVNMKTMSIAAMDKDGIRDVYKLPKLEGDDYYGTAISTDQAGNFLIGHYFTKTPQSATTWTIFNPANGTYNHFDIGDPGAEMNEAYTSNVGVGRTDCVGRVIGDLTQEAVFFIAPYGTGYAQVTRFVSVFGLGEKGDASQTEMDGTVWSPGSYLGSSGGQNIAQPKYTTLDEIYEKGITNSFILLSAEGGQWDQYMTFENGVGVDVVNKALKGKTKASTKGFDTFVTNGKRYYVINYLDETEAALGTKTMNIAVFDENGFMVANWKNNDYPNADSCKYGYSSITAEPLEDGSVNIYVYNCHVGAVAGAMLNFKAISDPTLGTADNPVKIATAEDFMGMGQYVNVGDTYFTLENDIDLEGLTHTVIVKDEKWDKAIHFDGKNHVISNLTVTDGNASLFGALTGEVKNLGLENVNLSKSWYCVGGITGQAYKAKISNCYVTGTIRGAASGGIVGATFGEVEIENCYTNADVADEVGGHSAGIAGRVDNSLTISNAYAAGPVSAMTYAAGIANARNTPNLVLNNVIAWNPYVDNGIKDGETAPAEGAIADPVCTGEATQNNVYVWNEMQMNGKAVANGKSTEELQAIATAWSAYSKELIDGMPVLAWQNGETGGVAEIEIEDTDAAPVYYNLQGVQVTNPEGGIFIVRRGNKVTKEYVR